MQTVREQLLREDAVIREELVVEVAPEYPLAVRELLYLLVDDLVALSARIVHVASARKDRCKDDHGFRLLGADRVQYLPDAEDRIDRRFLLEREMP